MATNQRVWYKRDWFILLLLLIMPVIILLVAWGVVKALNAGPASRFERELGGDVAWQGDTLTAMLVLRNEESAANSVVARTRPCDVMVCVDRSGSMGDPGDPTSGLAEAVDATVNLCRTLGGGGARVGLMVFDDRAQLVSPFTDDPQEIVEASKSIRGGGGTEIDVAMDFARQTFAADTTTKSHRRFLVILSDFGDNDTLSGQIAVQELLSDSVSTIAIGIGFFINQAYLFRVYTPPSQALLSVETEKLISVFDDIVLKNEMLPVWMKNVQFTEHLDPRDFSLAEDPRRLPYLTSFDSRSGRIEFFLPTVFTSVNQLPYLVEPLTVGVQRLGLRPATASLVDAAGQSEEWQTDKRPYVLVLSWWLLALLWLPALVYLLLMASRNTTRLFRPHPRLRRLRLPEPDTLPSRTILRMHPVPSLIVGVGGEGYKALVHFKQVVAECFDRPEEQPYRYILLDTDRRTEAEFEFCGQRLSVDERIYFPQAEDIGEFLESLASGDNQYDLGAWAQAESVRMRGAAATVVRAGTSGDRRLGRLSFLCATQEEASVVDDFRNLVTEFLDSHAESSKKPVIILVGSGFGGTASGSILDIGVQIRAALGQVAFADSGTDSLEPSSVSAGPYSVPLYLYLTYEGFKPEQRDNAEALLLEIERMQTGSPYPGLFAEGLRIGERELDSVIRPLFDQVHLVSPQAGVAEVVDSMFHYCERTLASALVSTIGDARLRVHERQRADGVMRVCLPRAYSLRFPRGRVYRSLATRAIREFLETQLVGFELKEHGSGAFEAEFTLATEDPAVAISEWSRISATLDGNGVEQGDSMISFYRLLTDLVVSERAADALWQVLPDVEVIRRKFARDLNRWLDSEWGAGLAASPELPQGKIGVLAAVAGKVVDLLSSQMNQAGTIGGVTALFRDLSESLTFWELALLRNPATASGTVASPKDGLAVDLNRRMAALESEDNSLRQLEPSRTYIQGYQSDDSTDQREEMYREYFFTPLLEKRQLLSLTRWQVDQRMRLALRLRASERRVVVLKSDPASDSPELAANRLLEELWAVMRNQRDNRRFEELSLVDFLEGPSDPRLKNLLGDSGSHLHVLFSYPDPAELPELMPIETEIQKRLSGTVAYRSAFTDNPLLVSAHYLALDRPWFRNELEAYSGADWIQKSDLRQALDLPFAQSPEARIVLLSQQFAKTNGSYPQFNSAHCRALAENRRLLSIAARLDALGALELRQNRAQLSTYFLSFGGVKHPLTRPGEADLTTALQTLILHRRDVNGDELAPTLRAIDAAWRTRPIAERVALLKAYLERPLATSTAQGPPIPLVQLLRAVAAVELQIAEEESD